MHKHLIVIVGSLLVSLITASPATAATIIGGSNLLSQADADQLQSWLGEGNIAITNIFSHAPGDGKTSVNFHAAADGQGRTFSIIEVLAGNFYELTANGDSYVTISRQVIGGYNPQSWASVGGYNVTPLDAARTAFLFNLTNDLQQEQNLSGQGLAGSGQYQTVNAMSAGPTFGAGYDLVVYDNFATGSA
ncbi:MAG TPA: PEP_CTERM-anchored TLD domain-containing protein, partial [Pirellulaceae bacterium]|nr:PEP_CTERM-anchored TLD domain-containing protein [Pirellulaceae bacterium]